KASEQFPDQPIVTQVHASSGGVNSSNSGGAERASIGTRAGGTTRSSNLAGGNTSNTRGTNQHNSQAPGPARTLGFSPKRPTLLQDNNGCSHNWSVRFQNDPPIRLCVLANDPNVVAYNFQIHSSLVNELDSGWITSDHWDVPGPSDSVPV